MKLTVNGAEHELQSSPLTPLLHVLREELMITSPKAGCQQGGCGACTVLVDGEPRRACLIPVVAVDGARITTVEGLAVDGKLMPIQTAFYEHFAAQCGFCTPGFLLAGHALIEHATRPVSREDIIEALGGHLCRCTGYVKIVEAVEAAARGDVSEELAGPIAGEAEEPEVLVPGSPA